jgi:hypothetical protein
MPPNLVRQIGEEQRTVQLRQAVVTAVEGATGGTCTIKLGNGGPISGVRHLGSAAVPTGSTVWVLQQGYDLLVLGPVSTAPWGTAMQLEGLELFHPGSTPYIDFHRATNPAGSGADYNMRIINNVNGYLEVFGGRVRIGWAEIGTHPVHTSYAWFGRTAQAGSTDYAFLTNGSESIINSIDATYMSIGGNWVARATTAGLTVNTNLYAEQKIHFRQQVRDDLIMLYDPDYCIGIRSATLYMRTYRSLWLDSQEGGAFRLFEVNLNGSNDGLIVNNGWLRTKGERGVFNNDQGRGIYFQGGHVKPYPDGVTLTCTKHDHLGNWDVNPLWVESRGGGSGARISFRAAGQNSAPQIKSWGEAFEFRGWNDAYMIVTRSVVENYSRASGKSGIMAARERLPKAQRREKVKRLRTVHFNRNQGGCPTCVGTGLISESRRLSDADRIAAALLGGRSEAPCPDCDGRGMEWVRPENVKNEEKGWFGFTAEEVEAEFPEAVFYRQDEDGVVRPSGLDALALIAILWEDNRDHQEEIDALEARLGVLEAKTKGKA